MTVQPSGQRQARRLASDRSRRRGIDLLHALVNSMDNLLLYHARCGRRDAWYVRFDPNLSYCGPIACEFCEISIQAS